MDNADHVREVEVGNNEVEINGRARDSSSHN